MALAAGEVLSGGVVRDASGRQVVAVDPSSNYLPVPLAVALLSTNGATSAGAVTALGAGIGAYPQRSSGRPSQVQVDMTNANQVRAVMPVESYATILTLAATGGFNTTNGQLTVTAHGLSNLSPVSLHAATLPPEFVADLKTYYVTVVDANTLTFAASSGGPAIVPTTAGATVVVGPVSFAAQISTLSGTNAFTWFDGTASAGVSIGPVVALCANGGSLCVGPWVTVPAAAKADLAVRVVSNNPTATVTAAPVLASFHLQFK